MNLEEQKEVWTKAQLELASQVIVLEDGDTSAEATLLLNNSDFSDRFQTVPLLPVDDDTDDTGKNGPLYFGGVDVSFPNPNHHNDNENNNSKKEGGKEEEDPSVAVYVVLEYPSGKVVYQDYEYFTLQMPYIPSYLGFREIDPLQRLIEKQVKEKPQFTPRAILVDGNGIFHPRKAGIACFVGVRTGIPTIGIGKTLFYEGKLNKDMVLQELEEALDDANKALSSTPSKKGTKNHKNIVIIDQQCIPKMPTTMTGKDLDRGCLVKSMSPHCSGFAVPLTNEEGEVLACALVGHGGRIKSDKASQKNKAINVGTKNPIYVSVGHKVSLRESVRVTASFSFAKIPEPVRQADLIGRELLREKGL